MSKPERTIAIGDVHGCSHALNVLLNAISPSGHDLIVPLGDYVDRGPDSRGVLERLVRLGSECRLVPILGNHDEMFLHAIRGEHLSAFLKMGGLTTLESYSISLPPDFGLVPRSHVEFLERCVDHLETETHIFLHACYLPHRSLVGQPGLVTRWESIRDSLPEPHSSGKTVIVGHTSQKGGELLDAGHIKCIDTYCYGGGWLTALDVDTGEIWQANLRGELRSPSPPEA